jgi:hypothetical protein
MTRCTGIQTARQIKVEPAQFSARKKFLFSKVAVGLRFTIIRSRVGLSSSFRASTSAALQIRESRHMRHAADVPQPTSSESESDTYRVVILNGNGTKVRVVLVGDRYALPSVSVPRWQRVAENLTDAVKNEWGEEVICLFTPDDLTSEVGGRVTYEVTEHLRTSGTPRLPMRWQPVSDISQDCFADHCDYSAIVHGVAGCKGEMPYGTGPFTRLGWFQDLREWVESVIEPCGFHITENFRQLNASPSFSLVRFETNGNAVWFKAVGEPNQKEFPITWTLAELFPNYLPSMLGARPDWDGWLTQEALGTSLGEGKEVTLWEHAADSLAKLQIESVANHAQVLVAGARDQRIGALSNLVRPFMEAMARLMEQQTKISPAILGREELSRMGDCIESALDSIQSLGIPDTLGHSDLNPWNIIVLPPSCAFLDWAEAHVGNPFLSFQYLLEHLRRTATAHPEAERRLAEVYARQWRRVLAGTTIAEAMSLAPLLAVFAYAAGGDGWTDEVRLREPQTAGYLRSLTRQMYCEVKQMKKMEAPCLP